jgi:hypothetical protein
MSENSPIKDALYAKIHGVGQERIHKLMSNGKFSELFEKIYETTINSIDGINEHEKHGIMVESLTHYLFTEMLIPSQRKTSFKNIELDMVIPNILELKKNNKNAILVFFAKTSNIAKIKQNIQEIKKIQNSDANIWVISKDNIQIPQTTYVTKKESYSEFLKDAQTFVKTKNMNKLNIFKTDV